MAYAGKVLAQGQLANSKTTIYTVAASTVAFIKQLRVFSTGSGQTVSIYLNPGGTSRKYAQFVLTTGESADVFEMPIQLEAGDLIEADSTSATTVDYVLTGVEQT